MARTLVVLLTMALPLLTATAAEQDYGAARQKMVETIAGLATRVTTPMAPASLQPS